MTQDIFESYYDNPFFSFVQEAAAENDAGVDLLVVKMMQTLLSKMKTTQSSISKSTVTVSNFVMRVLHHMASNASVASESKHEMLVCCLLVFSTQLPPSTFELELEL